MYLRPTALDEALGVLAARRPAILAGGTDFYPARVGRAVAEEVLDLGAIAELRGLRQEPDRWRIGALVTWTEVLEARLPRWFECLKEAAREVGGVQIQNAGTVAGNICNASPAADGVPALLALDAEVELASARGRRVLPLGRIRARQPHDCLCARRARHRLAHPAALRGSTVRVPQARRAQVSGDLDRDGRGRDGSCG